MLLASETRTKRHPEYAAAKSGDTAAAVRLVDVLVEGRGVAAVRRLLDATSETGAPVLVSAHAYEGEGINAIPVALARLLSTRLGVGCEEDVVQINVVCHTGADGYGRLARQAAFGGDIVPGRDYVLADDFIGQGGTIANLRGWVETMGGTVVAAVSLTGKTYSARLSPSQERLDALREKHGPVLEQWWHEQFGHTLDCLTHSEARYLARSPDVDTIRDRIAAAKQEGDGPGGS